VLERVFQQTKIYAQCNKELTSKHRTDDFCTTEAKNYNDFSNMNSDKQTTHGER
jgi:hypothetical protein